MNYFMSDICGAADAYFEMKNRIGFRKNDELFILGNIFDGNESNPEACIEILEDIMVCPNIHLILGNHEYAHVMFHLAQKSQCDYKNWEEYLLSPACNGATLHSYLCNELPEHKLERYLSFLVSCEMTETVRIGGNLFYLVHGCPAVCKDGDISKWQEDVVEGELELKHNYTMAIMSDSNFSTNGSMPNIKNLFVIAGHVQTKNVFEKNEELFCKQYGSGSKERFQKIICTNHKMLINCGCSADRLQSNTPDANGWKSDLACVGIDAAGFFTEYLLQNNQ